MLLCFLPWWVDVSWQLVQGWCPRRVAATVLAACSAAWDFGVCPVQPITFVCCVQWYGVRQAALEAPSCMLLLCVEGGKYSDVGTRTRSVSSVSLQLFGMHTCVPAQRSELCVCARSQDLQCGVGEAHGGLLSALLPSKPRPSVVCCRPCSMEHLRYRFAQPLGRCHGDLDSLRPCLSESQVPAALAGPTIDLALCCPTEVAPTWSRMLQVLVSDAGPCHTCICSSCDSYSSLVVNCLCLQCTAVCCDALSSTLGLWSRPCGLLLCSEPALYHRRYACPVIARMHAACMWGFADLCVVKCFLQGVTVRISMPRSCLVGCASV